MSLGPRTVEQYGCLDLHQFLLAMYVIGLEIHKLHADYTFC
jgi:hypothetical protein